VIVALTRRGDFTKELAGSDGAYAPSHSPAFFMPFLCHYEGLVLLLSFFGTKCRQRIS
jgi:hypothetical protein